MEYDFGYRKMVARGGRRAPGRSRNRTKLALPPDCPSERLPAAAWAGLKDEMELALSHRVAGFFVVVFPDRDPLRIGSLTFLCHP